MGKDMRAFEDALLALYICETEPLVKEIDRYAEDPISEANRFKREKREAKKEASEAYSSGRMYDSSGRPLILDCFGESTLCYRVNPSDYLMALKTKLETGVPLPEELEKVLGVAFDSTSIGVWAVRYIKWQAAAQVLWYYKPQARVADIAEDLLVERCIGELDGFLQLDKLKIDKNSDDRFRSLEDCIRPVNPRGCKVGRPRKTGSTLNFVPIPGIFIAGSEKMNINALHVAVTTVVTVLSLLNDSCLNRAHPLITLYKSLFSASLGAIVDVWIQESLEGC